jgi:hypothetical protein
MLMQEALAASSGATAIPGAPDAAAANEDKRQTGSAFSAGAKAVVQCPSRSVLTAGKARASEWVLTFEPSAPPPIDPLMGWIGSLDPQPQIRLRFPSSDAAIRYAERQGLHYELRGPAQSCAVVRSFLAKHSSIPERFAWVRGTPYLIPDEPEATNDNAGEPAHEDRTDRAAV